jgi:HD-GYP domain-containing protein (c-di-GMP phosphodiesterase class II)
MLLAARPPSAGYRPYTSRVASGKVRDPRFAELVALLSLGTDLGLGQPMEHMVRACLVALRLAEQLGLNASQRTIVYYSGLLAWVGCHTDAYEQAKWLGDDLSAKGDAHYGYDLGRVGPATAFMLKHVGGTGRPLLQRARVAVGFLGDGRRSLAALAENHYLATDELARRLGLGEDVREALRQSYERWDGKGAFGLRGAEVVIASRLINLADVVEVLRRAGGVDAAVAVARERSGTQFDPELVEVFCDRVPMLFSDLDGATSWGLVIDAEPSLGQTLPGGKLDDALGAIGEFAELKSAWRMGHATAVAELAAEAARTAGLPAEDVTTLRRSALVEDLGHLGVSNAIWDKQGTLSPSEAERVRLHPYLTQRMLSFSPALAPLGTLAGLHHERLDGSGYPRGLSGDAIAPAGRVLAAADVYQALLESRPHRPARSPEAAARELRDEVAARRLDGDAADAVLRAAGHRVRRRKEWPSGLTSREVEVLRLVARGLSNKEVARALHVSSKTTGTHVEHIYTKIGVSNRAQAALFAMRHGLMTDVGPEAGSAEVMPQKSGERPM